MRTVTLVLLAISFSGCQKAPDAVPEAAAQLDQNSKPPDRSRRVASPQDQEAPTIAPAAKAPTPELKPLPKFFDPAKDVELIVRDFAIGQTGRFKEKGSRFKVIKVLGPDEAVVQAGGMEYKVNKLGQVNGASELWGKKFVVAGLPTQDFVDGALLPLHEHRFHVKGAKQTTVGRLFLLETLNQ